MGTDIHTDGRTDGRILGSPSGLPFPALGFTTLGHTYIHTDFGVPLWTPLSSTRVYNPRTDRWNMDKMYQNVEIYLRYWYKSKKTFPHIELGL
jgi:hypothetical protein